MKTSEEVKEVIQRIIDNLAKDIQEHPHRLINEHDFKAYIYSILVREKSCNKFVIDKDNDENYLVHCEYCRGYYQNNGKFKNIGFWDIAILKEEQDNKFWWKEKPVFLGIELKLNIDEKSKKIIYDIECDQPAVDSEKGFNEYADYALLFHLNIGKKRKDETVEKVREYLEDLSNKNKKTFYVFMQGYKDKSKPETISYFAH